MSDNPTHCEVPGCRSVYCGKDRTTGEDTFKRGAADVYVRDHRGDKRGICCACYTRELAKAGKLSNGDLRDADGRMDAQKITNYHASQAQQALIR